MKSEDLKRVHATYAANIDWWRYLRAAYEGTRALVKYGVIKKHERESDENHAQRKEEAIGYNYSGSVVNLFAYYLQEKGAQRDLGSIATDSRWLAFADDADLDGSGFEDFLTYWSKMASIYGQVGILVDSPPVQREGVYPYVVGYTPESILDWDYERDPETSRPRLSMVKVREEDGAYLIWTIETWERWREGQNGQPELVGSDVNALGAVPFVWLVNKKTGTRNLGVSDIKDISLIDVSIMRNNSQAEEIIKYNAFPMLTLPRMDTGDDAAEVGPRAVLEFDPEFPESKPDWLRSSVKEPIEAILAWIDRKVQEVYRLSNAGGLNATENSTQAKSGVALRQEFQLLNTQLVSKANALEEAERSIVWLWLLWAYGDQSRAQAAYSQVAIERPKDFSIEDLAVELANLLDAKSIIGSASRTWATETAKRVARSTLPEADDETIATIAEELERNAGRVPVGAVEVPGDDE